ncbi:MAG: C69 family dipeptidase [Bacteroidota bacterium]
MNIIKILFRLLALNTLLFISFPVLSQGDTPERESFIILAGNKTTSDGSVVVAHNKGLQDTEKVFMQKRPRQKHDSTEVIRLQNGMEIPQTEISMSWMGLQTELGRLKGDAVAINEHQVSIAGSVSLEEDRNMKARQADPLVAKGVTGRLYYIALERTRTARECVKLIGEYYNKYGIAQTKGIAVADKKEVWYMEAGGGHHWAALKIPEDAVWVQANSYRIGHINPDDGDVMTSPGLLEFARENDLWDPDEQLFNFADAFGRRIQKTQDRDNFSRLKIWKAISLLDSTLRVTPDQQEYPQFVRPQQKMDMAKVLSVLRDNSGHISYNTLENDSITRTIRPIASSQVTHTSVVQLTNGLPSLVGAVLWAGFGNPLTTPYIPFYFGIKNVPKPYSAEASPEESAYSVYQALAERYHQDPKKYDVHFPEVWSEFQTKCFTEQVHIDRGAMRLYQTDSAMSRQFITINVEALSQQALDLARKTLK